MKLKIILFLSLISTAILQAQEDTIYRYPTLNLKFNPSALSNLTIPAAQVGAEYRAYKRLTFYHELGWMIRNNPYLWRRGYRHLTEARIYLTGYEPPFPNVYFGAQFRNWWFRAVDEGFFCRQNCAWTETMQYEIEQRAVGGAVSLGFQLFVVPDRLVLEFGGALGAMTRINRTDLPDDVELAGFDFEFFDIFGRRDRWMDYERSVPNIRIHFRLSYVLKK